MKIKPLWDNVLVKQYKTPESTSKSGIITNINEESKNKGTVVAIGQMCGELIEVGDTVLFGAYAGSGIKDENDVEFLVIKEEEILAKIEKE